MKILENCAIGIQQGNDVLFDDYQDKGEMWTGTGNREKRQIITFEKPYKEAPSVNCSLTLWDVDKDTNVRAELTAEYITETGFELVFRTWGDTKVARIRVGWMAIGPISHEDDWDLY